ncbi:MAG: L,D-transpeptidase family protein [Acidobacteriota bacterium]
MIPRWRGVVLVALIALIVLTPDLRADSHADAIRDLFDSDAWPALTIDGEHLYLADESAEVYRSREFAPIWPGRVRVLVDQLEQAESHGLRRDDYHFRWLATRAGPAATAEEAAGIDLVASDAFLLYALHLGRGKVREERIAGWHVERPDPDLRARLSRAATEEPAAALDGMLPGHPGYDRLRAALNRYRAIARDGGWPSLPDGPALRSGDRGRAVIALQQRLAASGDLTTAESSDEIDEEVVAAVRRFQTRHGLEQDGVVGDRTRAALNVSIAQRIEQLEINLERWRWLEADLGPRYVLVNIAGFHAGLYDGNRLTLGMRAIVGKPYRRTPIFSDEIRYLVFSPYWNLPSSIARQEIRPKGRAWMRRRGIEVLRGGRLRQRPGPDNPLGRVKFMFPNHFNVYLHDTSAPQLFDQTSRPFSHGCIRLQKPLELALELLSGQGWSMEEVQRAAERGTAKTVALEQGIPVHILYWTAWVDESDTLQFRKDVYARDPAVARALRQTPRH